MSQIRPPKEAPSPKRKKAAKKRTTADETVLRFACLCSPADSLEHTLH